MKKGCLIITATVTPNSNYVAISNTEQRLKEYYDNLLYYLDQYPDTDIYLIENSGYDFEKNESFSSLLSDHKLNFIQCPKSTGFEQGKGYQEFEMLDFVIQKIASKYDYFVKITGRYRVKNIDEFTSITTNNIVIDLHKKPQIAITSFFVCSMNFYQKNLKGTFLQANDSGNVMIENVMYNKLSEMNSGEVSLHKVSPIITGISGSYGKPIGRNPIKLKIRNLERVILRIFNINRFLIEY